jgi:hypothetical protein
LRTTPVRGSSLGRAGVTLSGASLGRDITVVGSSLGRDSTWVGSSLGDAPQCLPQPSADLPAAAGHPPPAVHLLGDVRQVEVRRERAHQPRRRRQVEVVERVVVEASVLAGERPLPLDQAEQLGSLLPDQRVPEDRGEPSDVRAQRGVVVGLDRGRRTVDRRRA